MGAALGAAVGGHTRLRVDVEFAHQCAVPCDERLTEAEIAGSTHAARGVLERLRLHDHVDVVTSVLVDDKKNIHDAEGRLLADIDDRRAAAVARCVTELRADRVMLESTLEHLLKPFAAALPAHGPVIDGFFSRLRKKGELGCSQDVTIWHSLRLGLFDPPAPGWAYDAVPRADAGPADVCVVVLPLRFQHFEEKAYRENLGEFLGVPVGGPQRMTLSGRIHDRDVLLWAIWVDVEKSESDLRELGRSEADVMVENVRAPVPATIG